MIRPRCTRVFYFKKRPSTRIRSSIRANPSSHTNPPSYNSNSNYPQNIRDLLQIITATSAITSLAFEIGVYFTHYYDITEEFIDIHHKLDTLFENRK